MSDIDVMEWLTSDVVTMTRRELAAYRRAELSEVAAVAHYTATLRRLLDAAAEGTLTDVERELDLAA
jgi:hypothetical protein